MGRRIEIKKYKHEKKGLWVSKESRARGIGKGKGNRVVRQTYLIGY